MPIRHFHWKQKFVKIEFFFITYPKLFFIFSCCNHYVRWLDYHVNLEYWCVFECRKKIKKLLCDATFLKLIIDVNFSIDFKLCSKKNCKDISDKFLLTVWIYTYLFEIFWLKSPGESIGLKFIPSQSELFQFISISVSKPMRVISNQSEKRFVSRLTKNGHKSIRLNPINSETWIRTNPKPSFQSTSIGARIDRNRIFNQNQSEWIKGRNDLDWFWLIWIEKLISD